MAALTLVALAAGVVALLTAGSDHAPAVPRPASFGAGAGAPVEHAAGASIVPPRGWQVRTGRERLVLSAPDRSLVLSVSSSRRARTAEQLLRAAVAALRRADPRAAAQALPSARVAGRLGVSAVVRTHQRGAPVRLVLSAARAGERVWLVQVLSRAHAPTLRLAQAQVALHSLQLGG